ncbi:MAG: hypothetical protein DRP09_20795 [Candidatus Thorarchaeota archaeon]|nr:MAG: hypothetical protein DRP09_20795 [Candidatus Thorarchaeota archaeon]
MTIPIENPTVIELFKFAPAVIALMGVVYLLYRLLVKKEETLKSLIKGTQSDIERQAKMITLLEILVNRSRSRG